ncbi:MAG: GNAT family N-acetyltransferase [Tatlockia sp.]|nr:GNAT family N-acetyltransferase [Tatlockia sp.]
MIRLDKNDFEQIYRLYLKTKFFFPLIASVLLDEQDGLVYVNNLSSPSQIYVEHSFGFSQIFGKFDEQFEQELERYLLLDKSFNADKIRLYAPYPPDFIVKPHYKSLTSFRQRLVLGSESPFDELPLEQSDKKIIVSGVNLANISIVENQFALVSRFWRNSIDFIEKSNAVVVYYDGEVASICYAAAQANNCVEIDVLTLPKYRDLGLAKKTVLCFINNCFELGLRPLWDCFINNPGSMMLSKSVGFNAFNDPYPFFTINK